MSKTGPKQSAVKRVRITVTGRVQGVGFRPHIYRHAVECGLSGFIRNTPGGVCIEFEGQSEKIDRTLGNFTHIIPSLARVDEIETAEIETRGPETFHIKRSSSAGASFLPIPPDLAICSECRREISQSATRRRRYAFNTCTICGPRFSIAKTVPFDRPNSSMEEFPLCEKCKEEYLDPGNRRFHAQTMSCPECGPGLSFFNTPKTPGQAEGRAFDAGAIEEAASNLKNGKTLAIKGIGGFHLACDAANTLAVNRIRERKRRPHKPLGLMVRDLQTADKICRLSEASRALLCSEKAPMVLAEKKESAGLPDELAPALTRIGLMLPYTPLHALLFDHPNTPPVLVMTSCNRSEEPIATDARQVVSRLSDLADGVLDNNRSIENRCDDSLAATAADKPVVFRRSRGYTPEPIMLKNNSPPVLAVGAMWKNTFTITSGRRAYMSQHIGDVSDADNADFFESSFRNFSKLLRIAPQAIACDLHPDYPTTRFAKRMADEMQLPLAAVQHHHAHVLSCLAEHSEPGPVIGIAMDGTGYGTDGNIWGGEFFHADTEDFSRLYHFRYLPMPGGDRAVSEPYRMALSCLADSFGKEKAVSILNQIDPRLPAQKISSLLDQDRFSPLTSSCGRLFDSVASLLGIRHRSSYEGQAACELEAAADRGERGSYPYSRQGGEILLSATFAAIWEEIDSGVAPARISARFHNTITDIITETCVRIRETSGLDKVVLTGGVMQNLYLIQRCIDKLNQLDFSVLTHSRVPPNDAGISMGQALYANRQMTERGMLA